MVNLEQQLITLNHNIIDSVITIIACLFLGEHIKKNHNCIFIHDGTQVVLSKELIIMGLTFNIKNVMIEDLGEQEGLNLTYGVLKSLYSADNDKPITLTPQGRDLLDKMLICLAEDIKAEQVATIH